MRHRILTCKNHPKLRWSCKDIAWTEGHGYNHSRHLCFNGTPSGKGMYDDLSGLDCTTYLAESNTIIKECECEAVDLILAPEDSLVIA